MKLIIAGSRTIHEMHVLRHALLEARASGAIAGIDEVVSGGAQGVDTLGELWAKQNHIPVKRFPADWENNAKAAGFIRNVQMANYADGLLAIWDGKSRGTKHMIEQMMKREKTTYVYKEIP